MVEPDFPFPFVVTLGLDPLLSGLILSVAAQTLVARAFQRLEPGRDAKPSPHTPSCPCLTRTSTRRRKNRLKTARYADARGRPGQARP
ncbi:hypothetical protein MTBLM5_90007 [Magnetospirillum sp. LM-5]|nr:hypothetical protein MTBLM5_90007 [Magnetospirillum sp. LM-5]